MKKSVFITVTAAILALLAASAFADSSGNFTAAGTSAACTATPAVFNSTTGSFEGATLSGGTKLTSFTASIQTPNGQGTALLIRPSLDTGLFTSTKLSTTVNNATADVGIMVCVYVDPTLDQSGNVIPGETGLPVSPANCIVYDQRIQQVSNTLFGNLSTCVSIPTTLACSTDADCPSGDVCGTTGVCMAPAPGCSFDILLTTLSAHSYDYVVPNMTNGTHNVVMQWGMIGTNNNTVGGNTQACVGPVSLTVQQVKNFHNTQAISFTSN
jgi:hypothetical protein